MQRKCAGKSEADLKYKYKIGSLKKKILQNQKRGEDDDFNSSLKLSVIKQYRT